MLGLAAPSIGAQSLTEVAKKEKERRKKNEQEGKKAKVITGETLTSQGPAFRTTVDTSKRPTTSRRSSSAARTRGESEYIEEGEERERAEPEVPAEIPADSSLPEKIAIFQRMVTAYRAQVKNIDEQIAKNNARLAELEQELNVIGGGVNMPPPVPQADFKPRNPGDKFALEAEQRDLRQKNQQLEAEKKTKADQLRAKGRRAGIPASYLDF
jgi:hypothetical protein